MAMRLVCEICGASTIGAGVFVAGASVRFWEDGRLVEVEGMQLCLAHFVALVLPAAKDMGLAPVVHVGSA